MDERNRAIKAIRVGRARERFSDKDRETAQDFVRKYGELSDDVDPASREPHLNPHAARDKTEEHDMGLTHNVGPDYGTMRHIKVAPPFPIAEEDRKAEFEILEKLIERQSERREAEEAEAKHIAAGGCVQEGFPDGREPNPLGWPDPAPWETPPPPGPQPTDIPIPKVSATVELKDTNPKDAVGIRKWRVFTTIPFTIIWELGVAMLEGARKYGRHNYRVAGVRGSVYVDAAMGHITQWWEGEDIDEESGLNHITKAIASLAVMRDAMINGKFVDDRPPKVPLETMRGELQGAVDGIFERLPEAKPAYLEGDQNVVNR